MVTKVGVFVEKSKSTALQTRRNRFGTGRRERRDGVRAAGALPAAADRSSGHDVPGIVAVAVAELGQRDSGSIESPSFRSWRRLSGQLEVLQQDSCEWHGCRKKPAGVGKQRSSRQMGESSIRSRAA